MYANEFVLSYDRHAMRAVSDFISQLLKVQDDANQRMILTAELARDTKESKFKPEGPYALIELTDVTTIKRTGEMDGTHVEREYECTIRLIFQAEPTNEDGAPFNIQGFAQALHDRAWDYLQPKDISNGNNGLIPTYPLLWRYSNNAQFKTKPDRRVSFWGQVEGISGSYYCIPLVFKFITYPTQPLT